MTLLATFRLADYSTWGEAERSVANVDALYHEYSGAPRLSLDELFAQMAEFDQARRKT